MTSAAPLVLLAAAALAPQSPEAAPVEVHALSAPQAVATTDGHRHAAYELLLTNYHGDSGPLRLIGVEVSGGSGAPLAVFDDDALAGRLVHPGRARTASDREARAIGAGEHALLYLWVELPDAGRLPRTLRHRLVFRTSTGRERAVDDIAIALAREDPPVFGPPFRSGTWLVHEGPGAHASHHWGSQLALNGRVTIPQRFAIDFLGLDADGRAVRGDVRAPANDNWVGFGAEVLAVEDGIVRDAHDGAADNVPLASRPPASTTARDLYGNYVVVQAGSHFVHYAHLQQGSVRARPGQRVRRGDVLGRVGNSGNTTGPHLHLHVSDRVTFEASDGLAFVFDGVRRLGQTDVDRVLDREAPPVPLVAAGPARRALPLDGTIVTFGVDRARQAR
jgi:hypothetical protein